MKSINIENLMNHSLGVSNSYYRPQENELLDDYLKAIEDLTIEKSIDDGIKKEVVEEKFKIIDEKYNNNFTLLREEMESKFTQLLIRVNVNKISERNEVFLN
ncbi:MAG TPA: hypothetical protein VN704_13270 [Verrucomicrobiae bacterium]|nr:hypothetical protein [Verrucomicrobiae bacterium]